MVKRRLILYALIYWISVLAIALITIVDKKSEAGFQVTYEQVLSVSLYPEKAQELADKITSVPPVPAGFMRQYTLPLGFVYDSNISARLKSAISMPGTVLTDFDENMEEFLRTSFPAWANLGKDKLLKNINRLWLSFQLAELREKREADKKVVQVLNSFHQVIKVTLLSAFTIFSIFSIVVGLFHYARKRGYHAHAKILLGFNVIWFLFVLTLFGVFENYLKRLTFDGFGLFIFPPILFSASLVIWWWVKTDAKASSQQENLE